MKQVGKETAGGGTQGLKPNFGGPTSTPQKRLIDCKVVLISYSDNSISVFLAMVKDALIPQCKGLCITSADSPNLERWLRDSDIAVFHFYGSEFPPNKALLEKIRLVKPSLIKVAISGEPEQVPKDECEIALDKYNIPSATEMKELIEKVLAAREG